MNSLEIDRLTFTKNSDIIVLHFSYKVDGMLFFGSVDLTEIEKGAINQVVGSSLSRIKEIISKDLGKEE